MCPFNTGSMDLNTGLIYFTIKIFLLVWVIFVPIVITSRLEKIIKILQEKNK